MAEAILGFTLLAGLGTRLVWLATLATFTLFAIVTAIEATQGKESCGCFGAVQIRPIYTMSLDLAAIALLLATGPPKVERQKSEGRRQNGEAGRGRLIIAAAVGVAWVGIALGIWLARPLIAVAATATQGQTFGNPGDLVVLELEKWTGRRFDLAEHIDIGKQLTTGQWIILLVHHDCDDCATAVPRYVEEVQSSEGGTRNEYARARLAVIEMPPFGDAADPPPWQLPASVFTGGLDQTRDWFATTPIALLVKDGLVIGSKGGDGAESPDPLWFQ